MNARRYEIWCSPKGGAAPFLVGTYTDHQSAAYAAADFIEAYGCYGDRFQVREI